MSCTQIAAGTLSRVAIPAKLLVVEPPPAWHRDLSVTTDCDDQGAICTGEREDAVQPKRVDRQWTSRVGRPNAPGTTKFG